MVVVELSCTFQCFESFHLLVVVVVVVSHIQRIGCQPEKTTLHGSQSRSWSAEQGKKEKEKVWQRTPPPPRARCSFGEKIKIIK